MAPEQPLAPDPAPIAAGAPILEVNSLTTRFATPEGDVLAVNRVSLAIHPGECLGIVGESGSGKSQLFLSIIGLLAANGRSEGSALFDGEELIGAPRSRLNRIRGARIAMVFQDPMTSLNPYLTIGTQLTEVLIQHLKTDRAEARRRSAEMLDRVRIPDAVKRLDAYPHELSGGMRQRVMIAMALLCGPDLLIADEPTTALDVTVQAQILELLADLRASIKTAIILITHDLGVVAGLADRVMVMYAGQVAETAPVRDLFRHPRHPYSQALLKSIPRLDGSDEELVVIPGQPPNLQAVPPGCAFQDRCPHVFERCRVEVPVLHSLGLHHAAACHLETAHQP